MTLSEQFWLSVLVQLVAGVAIVAMMKQQLRDLVGWVKEVNADVKSLRRVQSAHGERLARVEGKLRIARASEEEIG